MESKGFKVHKLEGDVMDESFVKGLETFKDDVYRQVLAKHCPMCAKLAHDTQPYPTAYAYGAVCEALRKLKDRIVELEAALDEVIEQLELRDEKKAKRCAERALAKETT
jgi:hypothetical protein